MNAPLSGCLAVFRQFALGVALALPISSGAFAACTTGVVPAQKIADFVKNPSSILFESGGGERPNADVVSDIRDMTISDPATLPVIIGLLKTDPLPSAGLQRAIGTGLGLAQDVCLRPDPNFAAEIQVQLAQTNSDEAKQQYAAVTGNQKIAAASTGSASGGASGGQINPLNNFGGGGTLQVFGPNSLSNNPINYFGGSTSGISTNTTTTIVTSVSPS